MFSMKFICDVDQLIGIFECGDLKVDFLVKICEVVVFLYGFLEENLKKKYKVGVVFKMKFLIENGVVMIDNEFFMILLKKDCCSDIFFLIEEGVFFIEYFFQYDMFGGLCVIEGECGICQ